MWDDQNLYAIHQLTTRGSLIHLWTHVIRIWWYNEQSVNPQVDLETIKDMYLEKFDVTLKDALDSDCSGDFKRLLIEILH